MSDRRSLNAITAIAALMAAAPANVPMGRPTRRRIGVDPARGDDRSAPFLAEPRVPDYHGVKRLAKAEAKRERKKARRASTPVPEST